MPKCWMPTQGRALLALRSGLSLPDPAHDQVISPENGLRYVYVYMYICVYVYMYIFLCIYKNVYMCIYLPYFLMWIFQLIAPPTS